MAVEFIGVGTDPNALAELPAPDAWGVTIQDISSSDSGRTADGAMHKDVVARKRTLSPTWNNRGEEEVRAILSAFRPTYVWVYYLDPEDGFAMRRFYTGDKSTKLRSFAVGDATWSSLGFSVIEA